MSNSTHPFNPRFAVCVTLALLFLGCAAPKERPASIPGHPKPYKIGEQWYQPLKESRGFSQRGIASWYGKDFHGRKTANGETYDMNSLTAAHKTLPLGTYVRVYNLQNNKTIDVRINDRGPFVRGRIIDLSREAAHRIGIIGPGTGPVKIVALGSAKEGTAGSKTGQQEFVPGNYYVGDFTIQVGAFRDQENAVHLRNKLARTYKNAHIVVHDGAEGTWYRVRVARCSRLETARGYEKMLEAAGYTDAVVVAR